MVAELIVGVHAIVGDDALHFGNACRKGIIRITRNRLTRVCFLLRGEAREAHRCEQLGVASEHEPCNEEHDRNNANTNNLDDVCIAFLELILLRSVFH